jgi:hypothetical protein
MQDRFFFVVHDVTRRNRAGGLGGWTYHVELYDRTLHPQTMVCCPHNHRHEDRARMCGNRMVRAAQKRGRLR